MIYDPDEQQTNDALDVGQYYLKEAINSIVSNLGVSPLTAATILHRESIVCLFFLGGNASLKWLTEYRMAFEAGDTPKGRRHNERGRVAFEKMANHFDLLTSEPEGKA